MGVIPVSAQPKTGIHEHLMAAVVLLTRREWVPVLLRKPG